MSPELIARYLRVLEVPAREPSLEALTELAAAHAKRVPFENISKLYYRKNGNLRSMPDAELFLGGIEVCNFGGTCYTNNYYLNRLLAGLGYVVKLCGADMVNPDVHIVNMVTVDGREYLVDVGYAAPFLAPLPRDLAHDYEVTVGHDRYVLEPQDAEGRSRMRFYRNGKLKHGYVAKPTARSLEHFADVIAHSYTDDATFMNALLLVRYMTAKYSVAIHNLTLIRSTGAKSLFVPIEPSELDSVVAVTFGIPHDIVADAVADLGPLQDAWS
jgi:arylamine N-acetyltransferase